MNEEMKKRIKTAKFFDRLMTGVFSGIGGFFLGLIIVLAGYIIIKGILSYYPGIFAFNSNGIGNQFFNTIYLVFLSLLISVPSGVLAGIYMAEYAGDNKLTKAIRISIESLSSLPSIVVGLFGYLVFILMTGMKWNLFAGALAVSILSLPSITTTTEDALRSLPKSYKEGSMGLGATHWTTITKVMLPACISRIMTGVILAAGRGFNPFRPGETLALHIWVMRTEGSLNANSEKIANFSAMVLVVMVLAFSLLSRYLTKKQEQKQTGAKA